jgi:hypothetical protein
MSFTYTKAERQKIGGLIGISGPSGSGKTRSAFHIAKGLANGSGSIACIDTESGRALHYAPKPGQKADSSKGTFDFHHVDFEPPFTPERYVEAIRFCEGNGATVIIFDSTSHEWAGEGGCADMQAQEAERMAKAAAAKTGRAWESMVEAMTAPAWSKPKQRHKRMVSKLLQSRAHLIFCLRAEEKIKIVDRKVVPIGFQPICEKSFPFELTCSMMLHPNNPGCPDYGLPYKLNDELQSIFPDGQRIGDEAGARLRGWLETGVERPASDKIADGVRDLIEEIQDAADMAALQEITSRARVKHQRTFLSDKREDLAKKVDEAVAERLAWFEQIDAGADELAGAA